MVHRSFGSFGFPSCPLTTACCFQRPEKPRGSRVAPEKASVVLSRTAQREPIDRKANVQEMTQLAWAMATLEFHDEAGAQKESDTAQRTRGDVVCRSNEAVSDRIPRRS